MKKILILITMLMPMLAGAEIEKVEVPDPLVIEDVQCEGNTATECTFIKGQVFLYPGDIVNEEEVNNAKIRLSTLPNFRSTDIYLKKGSQRGRVILVIEVEEGSPYLSEIRAGTSIRDSHVSERVGGRIAHQNLFGKGKILDLEVDARIPVADSGASTYTRLQYIDPHLLGSKKSFLVQGVTYHDLDYNYDDGDFYRESQLGLDFALGRRIWDFSYISVGYQTYLTSDIHRRYTYENDEIEDFKGSYDNAFFLNYGWNSEDDPYFPTHGSRFGMTWAWYSPVADQGTKNSNSADSFRASMGYRTNWVSDGGAIWSFKLGGTPGTQFRPSLEDELTLSLAYARNINKSGAFEGIKRGRWFVEPGLYTLGYSSFSGFIADPGMKAGIRFETESLGVIDLYAIGSSDWGRK